MQIRQHGACSREKVESVRVQQPVCSCCTLTEVGPEWLTGLFSVGFTDIPYCDCLGGKFAWQNHCWHAWEFQHFDRTWLTLLPVFLKRVKLLTLTHFLTIFASQKAVESLSDTTPYVWKPPPKHFLLRSLLGQKQRQRSLHVTAEMLVYQPKDIK